MSAPPGLTQRALQILQETFGYPAFRGQQEEVIQHVGQGGDALVLMPTGGGKSLCYQIPALLRHGVAVVVSPLIALMQDQVDALIQVGIKAAVLNSTVSWEQARETEQSLFANQLDLLYVAPERLMTDRFLALLDSLVEHKRLALFAIDEAHCVSQWGHDFRPEYLQLSALHERYPEVPRIALTATADETTRNEIIQRLGLEEARIFLSSFDRPNIRYGVEEKDNPRRQLLGLLNRHPGHAGIIYCLSRKKVDETAEWLNQQGYPALPYHAGLSTEVRAGNQRRFLREEGLIMVATIAFGMGIDKPDVRFVAHLDLPKSLEAYYQETGRAGRDGEPAEAWMVYGMQDIVLQQNRIDESQASPAQQHLESQKLSALLAFCEAPRCRRQVLLSYFGEGSAPCGNCDICLYPPDLFDGTVLAQKALSAALRTGMRYGAGHLIDVLRGKKTDKIRDNAHDQLPTFGVGKDLDDKTWRTVFRQLLATGLLRAEMEEYGALKLTDAARPVLKNETTLLLRRPSAKKTTAPAKTERSTGETLSMEAQSLFDALREWRARTARSQGVPAYVILHDKTLRLLASERPSKYEELGRIPGLGNAKITRYGEELLFLCRETI